MRSGAAASKGLVAESGTGAYITPGSTPHLRMRLLYTLFATLTAGLAQAQSPGEAEGGWDRAFNDAITPFADAVAGFTFFPINPWSEGGAQMPIVVVLLLTAAVVFTVYFGFIQFRQFGLAKRTVEGRYSTGDEPGEVTHFQALTAALSGTVGLGNIGSVAVAIGIGGPGATFWMIVAGLLGMATKFAECTLGVRYRDIGPDGTVYGGPMYYLKKGLADRGHSGLGKVFSVLFAVFCVGGSFGGGNMFQSNQAAAIFNQQIGATSGSAGFVFGVVMALLVGLVILGGIKRIASVTERIVPFMVGVYLVAALIVIAVNIGNVPGAFGQIFSGAFSPEGIAGGFVGVLVQGFRRAAFSNEAGVGSAAIAHSAVKTRYAASEGLVALLEPFIDTVVVCTITALVIVIANGDGSILQYGPPPAGVEIQGVEVTSSAFSTVIPWFPYVLTVAVMLFAFSTQLSWSYYGLQAWLYLFGKSKAADISYKLLFLVFVVLGASVSLGAVISFSDSMIFLMSVPNLIGVFILLPIIKKEYEDYVSDARAIDEGMDVPTDRVARVLYDKAGQPVGHMLKRNQPPAPSE